MRPLFWRIEHFGEGGGMKGRGVGAQGIQTSKREGGLKLVCVALEGLDALRSDCQ